MVQQLGVRDLRRLEGAYISSREPTACATQNLTKDAFSTDQTKLNERVLALVTEARGEARATRRAFRARKAVLPIPALRSAERSVGEAMDAQVALYDAMVSDPTHTEGLLRTLGHRNTRAEHRLALARSLLLVGETNDWRRRFICDHRV